MPNTCGIDTNNCDACEFKGYIYSWIFPAKPSCRLTTIGTYYIEMLPVRKGLYSKTRLSITGCTIKILTVK